MGMVGEQRRGDAFRCLYLRASTTLFTAPSSPGHRHPYKLLSVKLTPMWSPYELIYAV